MEPLELAPGRHIGEGLPCFVVAEIGQNHQGEFDIAKTLIKQAKECGADCVKLQKSCLGAKFTSSALSRPYDSPHSFGATYGDHKQHLEFSPEEVKELIEFASGLDLPLTASAMDIPTVDLLTSLGVPFIKIGSGDVHNLQLIRRAATTGLPLVISTGMCDIAWVSEMYRDITSHAPGAPIVLLQCTSAYPSPSAHAHLRVMDTYAQMFPRAHIGFSGHELGIHISVAAVARGARVLERHLTLDKGWKGTDHACSLEPREFREMMTAIRSVEAALGSPLKAMQPSEDACYKKLGKTVVASRDLIAGEELTEDDLVAKVCGTPGLPASALFSFIGRRLRRDIANDTPIVESDIIT